MCGCWYGNVVVGCGMVMGCGEVVGGRLLAVAKKAM